ncbi:hypothetical protein GGI06_006370, partial [Coemansia sp. S85]
ICKHHGLKPILFIIALDSDFDSALTKDTNWQSEHLDSIFDQDPQQISIQQGMVSARYSTIADGPVKDILDGIHHGHIAVLLNRNYGSDVARVPVIEYIGTKLQPVSLPVSFIALMADSVHAYQLPDAIDQLPELGVWLEALAGPTINWLCAWLAVLVIVEGSSDNCIQLCCRQ